MKLKFTKMHGLGNDFIVVDRRGAPLPGAARLVRKLADRRFGIGFDQAIILKESRRADFRMDIYNADGSRVEMCGNGIRCLARYIWDRRLSRKKALEIETPAGIIRPEQAGRLVRVDMGEPVFDGLSIPTTVDAGRIIDLPLEVGSHEGALSVTCVSMGNPHCVVFVDDVEAFPVARYGPILETHDIFPKRTNVEFVEVKSGRRLRMRVWERGSGQTLACGTGACASAVAARIKGLTGGKVTVELDGGSLDIEYATEGRVYMTGPADEVFRGEVDTAAVKTRPRH
ncbi:MAG TPA: diaminopimelate epimerase [Deltaproteobacteria bacterium]|nr:diaminopimelate epimerase [Deltaproteobacteria bacterium]